MLMKRVVQVLVVTLAVALLAALPGTAAGARAADPASPSSSTAPRLGTCYDNPDCIVKKFMKNINRGKYKAASKRATKRVVASGKSLRRYGFKFFSFRYCEPGDSALWECLAWFKRSRDGLEGSMYFDLEGTPGYVTIVRTYVSYGD